MKKIIFKWNNTIHKGVITEQKPSDILGMMTVISVTHIGDLVMDCKAKMTVTMFGKCEVGYCGPYTVISISNPINNNTVSSHANS